MAERRSDFDRAASSADPAPPGVPSIADIPRRPTRVPLGEFRATVGSPVVLGIAGLGTLVSAAFVNMRLMESGSISSHAYASVIGVLGPFASEVFLRSDLDQAARIGMGLAVAAFVLVVCWTVAVVRAPRARPETAGTVVVALIGLPTFWLLPQVVIEGGPTDVDQLRLQTELMLVFAVAAGIARAIVTVRIWRAGGLPAEVLSLFVSLPAIVTSLLLAVPSVIAAHSIDERGLGDPFWAPTPRIIRLAELGSAATFLATVGLLLVATVNQRVRYQREKDAHAEDVAEREALEAEARLEGRLADRTLS